MKIFAIIAATFLVLATAQAQSPFSSQTISPKSQFQLSFPRVIFAASSSAAYNPADVTAAGANSLVLGNGTIGRIPKWTGFTSGNAFLGNSIIFESKLGDVGIGTDNPVFARLTVVDTRSFLESAAAIRAIKAGESGNGLIAQGGDGSSRASAGSGAVGVGGDHSTGFGGIGLQGRGGNGRNGGEGASVIGGNGSEFNGGSGIEARGGQGTSSCCAFTGGRAVGAFAGNGFNGGDGVFAEGGDAAGGRAGDGVSGRGGKVETGEGGRGVFGNGGFSKSGAGGIGVIASGGETESGTPGVGLLAFGGSRPVGTGLSARFLGDVEITGTLTKGGGMFKIDHPLDPANKYLSHSFVESPEMKNVYDGVVLLGRRGEAVVVLPDYFQALNRDFRYQLTAIGAPGPRLYIAREIRGNRFRIAGGAPRMKVSWQVTGVRHDPWAAKAAMVVEEEKPAGERGYYLHPEAYGLSEEKGLRRAPKLELSSTKKHKHTKPR